MARGCIFILILISNLAYGHLTFWVPANQSAVYVLPEGRSPQQYLRAVQESKSLKPFVQNMKYSTQDRVSQIKTDAATANERALLLANNAEDHSVQHIRVDNFGNHFSKSYIIPVGAALGLSAEKRSEFYKDLGQHFKLLVAMGGDDIHPGMYSSKVTHSYAEQLNLLRDSLEAEIIRYFYYQTDRLIFAVCRGLQLTSVVLGARLHQDFKIELGNTENHSNGALHKIFFAQTDHNLYSSIMKKAGTQVVNSYHHQSVLESSLKDTALQVAARSPEGVVEALESQDGRVMLVQSHPEKLDNSARFMEIFFRGLRSWAQISHKPSCKRLVE